MSSGASTPRSHWIVNPAIDLLALGAGASGLVLLASAVAGPWLTLAVLYLAAVVVDWPHLAGSLVRVYGGGGVGAVRSHPFSTLLWPLVLLGLSVLTLVSPDGVGPWFVKLFLLWTGLHYARQSLHVVSLYFARSGSALRWWEKPVVLVPLQVSFLAPFVQLDVQLTTERFYGVLVPSLSVFLELLVGRAPFQSLLAALPWVQGGAALVLVAWAFWRYWRSRVAVVGAYAVVGSQLLWFAMMTTHPAFYQFVPLLHALQALVLIHALDRPLWEKHHPHPPFAFLKYYGFLFLLGGCLFEAIPSIIARPGFRQDLAYAAVITFFHLHHHLLEPVVWKLRSQHTPPIDPAQEAAPTAA